MWETDKSVCAARSSVKKCFCSRGTYMKTVRFNYGYITCYTILHYTITVMFVAFWVQQKILQKMRLFLMYIGIYCIKMKFILQLLWSIRQSHVWKGRQVTNGKWHSNRTLRWKRTVLLSELWTQTKSLSRLCYLLDKYSDNVVSEWCLCLHKLHKDM